MGAGVGPSERRGVSGGMVNAPDGDTRMIAASISLSRARGKGLYQVLVRFLASPVAKLFHSSIHWPRMVQAGRRQTVKAQWIIAGIIVAAMAVPAASTAGKPTRQTPEERLTQALKDMEAGTPTSCIPARQQGSTSVFGNTILYRQSARLLWRNDTGGHCGRRDDILVTRVRGSSLCRREDG